MKLDHLLAGFGVVGGLLVCSPSCDAEGTEGVNASVEASEDAGTAGNECECKNAKYSGFSLNVGLNYLSRDVKTSVSDDYFSKSAAGPALEGQDFHNERLLKKSPNNFGLHVGLDYDFVASNGLLAGIGVFADCLLGSREKSENYVRQCNEDLKATYGTKYKANRFVPGLALRLGTHFDTVDACLYITGGVRLEKNKTYLSEILVGNESRTSLDDTNYSSKKACWFYGVGMKKLLPSKFFGHSLGLIAEVKHFNNKSGKKTFVFTVPNGMQKGKKVTTHARTNSGTWLVSVSAVINF